MHLLLVAAWSALAAVPQETLPLPPPHTSGGAPLQTALRLRQSQREFSTQALAPQTLSDLLWAALGVNRPETQGRTTPSALNSQEIDLYVALPEGVYLYSPTNHSLKLFLEKDIRTKTGGQPFVKEAPVALVYVANYDRMPKVRKEDRDFYAAIDAAFPIQNVYLFCASEGLACVVHELERAPINGILSLGPNQKVILAQSVGHPKPPPKTQ
jgi:hypothetical protein